MAFSGSTAYSGAIANGDTLSGSLLNSLYLQVGASTANRPAPGNAGVAFVTTSSFTLARDNGSAWVDLLIPATQAQVEAETTADAFVTPEIVRHASGVAKGWCKFDAAGTISTGYNVASITDNDTGHWTVNWDTSFTNANYVVVATPAPSIGGTVLIAVSQLSGSVDLEHYDVDNGSARVDSINNVFIAAFGDQP